MEKAGLPEILIQDLCEVAIDYQNGIFSGDDKVIVELTGKAPMAVQEFVPRIETPSTARALPPEARALWAASGLTAIPGSDRAGRPVIATR